MYVRREEDATSSAEKGHSDAVPENATDLNIEISRVHVCIVTGESGDLSWRGGSTQTNADGGGVLDLLSEWSLRRRDRFS